MKTHHKFAKVYNPTTQTVTEIPKAELAPGMILASYEGVGQVWVSQEQVKQGQIRHASLPEDFLEVAEVVYDGFAVNDGRRSGNLLNMSRQQWLDGFRCDVHPYRELAIWGNILSFYNFARKRHGVGKSLEWLVDLYRVSLFIYTNGADAVLDTFEPRTMSRLEVQALLELHRQNATKPEDEASELNTDEGGSESEDFPDESGKN
ncbi:MAG: hypothetical protein ABSD58_04335 [Verrucomicrobiia bacterium]|jgi:hypothetical protein